MDQSIGLTSVDLRANQAIGAFYQYLVVEVGGILWLTLSLSIVVV